MKKRKITITDLSGFGKCEKQSVLKRTIGRQVNEQVDRLRLRGIVAHQQYEKQDQRCFIASHVYGVDDVGTCELRAWRDKSLRYKWYGSGLIRIYYGISPYIVKLLQGSPFMNQYMTPMLRVMLDAIRKCIK